MKKLLIGLLVLFLSTNLSAGVDILENMDEQFRENLRLKEDVTLHKENGIPVTGSITKIFDKAKLPAVFSDKIVLEYENGILKKQQFFQSDGSLFIQKEFKDGKIILSKSY